MHPAISTVIRKSIFFEWFCFIHSRFRTATWSENPAWCKEAKGINKPRTKAKSSWRFPPIQNGPTCLQHTMAVGHALCYIQRAPHSRAHTCDTKFCFTIISFLLSFFCFFVLSSRVSSFLPQWGPCEQQAPSLLDLLMGFYRISFDLRLRLSKSIANCVNRPGARFATCVSSGFCVNVMQM